MAGLEGKDVEFFGRITASMTHEFKNVLAIIKEASGLMEDITKISPLSDSRHQEKFDNALKTIKLQLDRGMELSTVFNRFAHSPDKPVAEITLKDLVDQVVLLSERFARLRRIALKTAPEEKTDKSITAEGNPVILQMSVFKGIECCLNSLHPESSIILACEKYQGRKSIRIDCAPQKESTEDRPTLKGLKDCSQWQELEEIMKTLGGSAEKDENPEGIRLIF